MQNLAAAMGVRPQNLSAYLKGERKIGPKYWLRLKEIGFFFDDEKNTNCVTNAKSNTDIDFAGAIELANTSAVRLAQLMGVPFETFNKWINGTESPNIEELARLFNLVIAIALARCKETNHTPVERQVAG